MAGPWFSNKRSSGERLGFVKPLTWQGWAVQLGTVFIFAILAQMIGAWIFTGFRPLATGVWLAAAIFLLIGIYIRIVRRFSGPAE